MESSGVETFKSSHASASDWHSAADTCLAGLSPIPSGANLGFVYMTDAMAGSMEALLERYRVETGIEHWVGTVGMGVCASGIEYYDRPALSVLIGTFPDDSFQVFEPLISDVTSFESDHGEWLRTQNPYFGVVHGDPRNAAVPALVDQLSQSMGSGFLVGGLASSRERYAQIADTVSQGGLSGVLFSPDVAVSTRLTQGCSPIGTRHQVTRAEENLVLELDGRPALDVLKEDVGEVLARYLRKVAGYIFVGLPIEGADTGDYLVRNLVGLDPVTGTIAIGDYLPVGSPMLFCRRDGRSAVDDLRRMLAELKTTLKQPPRGGIYCTCIGRGINLFGANSEELTMIRNELGEFPLAGFYANGEISNNRLYTYTGVLSLFL